MFCVIVLVQMFDFLQAVAATEGGAKAAVKAAAATNQVPTFAEAVANPSMVMHQILASAPEKHVRDYDVSATKIKPW